MMCRSQGLATWKASSSFLFYQTMRFIVFLVSKLKTNQLCFEKLNVFWSTHKVWYDKKSLGKPLVFSGPNSEDIVTFETSLRVKFLAKHILQCDCFYPKLIEAHLFVKPVVFKNSHELC